MTDLLITGGTLINEGKRSHDDLLIRNGRIESIFMSLPPKVDFRYNWEPRKNGPYHEMNDFYQPQNWC